MDVTTEISRINKAKADIRNSIQNKGVTVPSSAKIDEYSQYIDAISTSLRRNTDVADILNRNVTEITIEETLQYGRNLCINWDSLHTANTTIGGGKTASAFELMFYNCTSLSETPNFTEETPTEYAYADMFRKCTALEHGAKLPSKDLNVGCYSGMYKDCTSLVDGGEIAAEGNISECTHYMYENCINLREVTFTASEPPTISEVMFEGCPTDITIYVPSESVVNYTKAPIFEQYNIQPIG